MGGSMSRESLKRRKIALVGAGNIGGTVAHLIGLKSLGDIALYDLAGDISSGKALDLSQAFAIDGCDVRAVGGNKEDILDGADAVVVTAGSSRKPGMSRDDLLALNLKVMKNVGNMIARRCPNAFVICVTNPLDVMVTALRHYTGFASHMVVGMAAMLDTARFRFFLAEALNVSVEDVHMLVLGGHGDTMLPITRTCSVGGIPLEDILSMGMLTQKQVDDIVLRTRHGGAEVLKLLGSCSAYYAPATAIVNMLEAFLLDRKRLVPCAAYLDGHYGVQGYYVGVPVLLGGGGIERILEIPLRKDERKSFDASLAAVQSLMKKAIEIDPSLGEPYETP